MKRMSSLNWSVLSAALTTILLMSAGCEDSDSVGPAVHPIEGIWQTDFSVTYIPCIVQWEPTPLSISYSAELNIGAGRIDITYDPPLQVAYPTCTDRAIRSFHGAITLHGDTAEMRIDNSDQNVWRFRYGINGDQLYFVYLPQCETQPDGTTLCAIPLNGLWWDFNKGGPCRFDRIEGVSNSDN